MDKFIAKHNIESNFCDILLILTNSTCPISSFEEIKNILPTPNKHRILIDQILHIGNNSERFIYLKTYKKNIIRSSINFIEIPKNDKIRVISKDVLLAYDLIDFSILTPIQKKLLNKGIAI